MKRADLVGKTFGELTVASFSHVSDNHAYWICKCSCGNEITQATGPLNSGNTKSCGCSRKDINKTHGEHSNGKQSKEYTVWLNMKQRCSNDKIAQFKDYGGRGIKVCKRWMRFENFLADMGRAPSPQHSVERKNNSGNYTKSNCKWATRKEQANNQRTNQIITYRGENKTLKQWCDQLNLHYDRMRFRIVYLNWSVEEAFSTSKLKSRHGRN